MTFDGKFCSNTQLGFSNQRPRIKWAKAARLAANMSRIFGLALALLVAACTTSKTDAESSRTAQQREDIKSLLAAGRLIDCKLINQEWFIPGDVKQAQVVRSEGKWSLIYEAILRSGPRTVFQSLTPGLAFQGDGVVLGTQKAPLVSDLRTFEDAGRHPWTVSRVRIPGSELSNGMVEVVVKDSIRRSILSVPANESVQQIWPVLPAGNGVSNIIVRTTPVEESGAGQSLDESTYHWFQVNTNENSGRLVSTYRARGLNIQPAAFVALEKTAEPIAVSIMQAKLSDQDVDPRIADSSTRISLNRLFTQVPQEKVIFTGKGTLSGLTVSNPGLSPNLHLAWIFNPVRGSSRYIQTTSIPVRFIPERYFSRASLRDIDSPIATEINYEANDPEFLFTNVNQNQPVPVLGWWAKLENEVAVVLHPISVAQKKSRTTSLKSADGAILGFAFQPSLAVIPPKSFTRVMSFAAAPSASEKNIIVLSNRSDSTELVKETTLLPCTF
ncbi:hypothetical protein EBU99_00790 [bacterium]|nr:hypothetical protein [bacterium]